MLTPHLTTVLKRQPLEVIAIIAVLVSAVSLAKMVSGDLPAIDFGAIWTAGTIWNDGLNPYSDRFAEVGRAAFQDTQYHHPYWLYPPHWWTASAALAKADFNTAKTFWLALNLVALATGSALFAIASRSLRPATPWWLVGFFFAFLFIIEGTRANFYLGQTTIIIFLGLGMLIFGLMYGRQLVAAFGLAILLLKPHIGLPFLIMCAYPKTRLCAAISLAIVAALSLPPMIVVGPREFVAGLLQWQHNISAYAAVFYNQPQMMTGLSQLFVLAGIPVPSTLILATAAGAVGLIATWRAPSLNAFVEGVWLFGIVFVCAIVPLHTYDLILVAPLLLLLNRLPRLSALAIGIGLIVLARARSVALFVTEAQSEALAMQAQIATAGLALVTFGTLVLLSGARNRTSPTPQAPSVAGETSNLGRKSFFL